MKKIVREYDFSPAQRHTVRELSRSLGLTETTAGILYARGMDDERKMRRFLHPSKENFLSPFLMRGMKEAKELIEQAREEEWRVVVYGDYDADGIGACAILSRALREFGVEPIVYVPEREDGYGLNAAAIDSIFDEFLPDLFITVDCGISNYREVDYIREQGAFVIVTDHHELPERLPDCICINPKFKDDYPFDNLCGAGVAFKLAAALIGERANALLDFCALSTVADSVPLLGENRDIVSEGLRLIERAPRPAFSALFEDKQGEITAQTLAFTLAPRVNAAGRMGDAHAALQLFLSEDEEEIAALSARLKSYNAERQLLCNELYEKARAEIDAKGAYGNVVMLVGEDWHAGLIGIVAARIAEEYARPAILFVRKGDMLRGSARSIEKVNIFEALKASSEWIEEFGGHAQAAGVNVREENFEALQRALDEYIGGRYAREDFIPAICVSEEIEGEFPRALASELERLEPYGVGNPRPLFSMRAGKTDARPLKPFSPHLAVTGGALDLMYFGGAAERKLLQSDIEKHIVFECNLSRYRGRESVKGFIRTIVYNGESGTEPALDGFESLVRTMGGERAEPEKRDEEALNALIGEKNAACAYGLCVVAFDRNALARFPALAGLPREVYRLSSGSVRNAVLLCPEPGYDLSAYRDVVFLEGLSALPVKTGKAEIYENADTRAAPWENIPKDRASMVEIFSALRAAEGRAASESLAETARALNSLGFAPERFVFALAVFEELGLVDCSEGRLRIVRGKKTELNRSSIYAAALGEE